MSNENQRYYVFVSWKNGRDANKIYEELSNAEGERALSIVTIRRWIAKFKDGETNFEDKPRSGRPREAVTSENIAKVKEFVTNDSHITTRRLEDVTGVSHERIIHILHNELQLKKVCAKWVPHKLSADHKANRVEISKQLLEVLENGYDNIITGDETWMYFFTVSSKESNKVWLEKDEDRPQIVRTAKNSKKRMFVFFYTVEGVVARIAVQKGKTVNADLYKNHILPEVFSKFMEKRGRTTVRDVMLHHDNAAPHKAGIVTEYLKAERVKLLPHPPYSPDLAPCDFYLFPKIKKELGGRSFNSIENLSRAIQAIVDSIPKEQYYKSFDSWKNRLKKCIEVEGEYFEGMS
jgi:histone-lysine N-methyltransferase SETMAR